MHPSLSLRGHGCAVTASCAIALDPPTLISGDESGTLISWDLYRRRPRSKWQAHSSAVISLVPLSSSRILSHGKDESIKIWDTLSPLFPSSPIFSLPANTLNFCNVVVSEFKSLPDSPDPSTCALSNHLHLLFTAAGASSNNIDVYTISPDSGFCRVIANLDPHALYTHASSESSVIPEIGSAARDFGIIMRISRSKAGIVLGYESGHVIELAASNWLDEDSVTISYLNEAHSPNPVTSLALMGDGRVASASTSSKLLIHQLEHQSVRSLGIPRSGTHAIDAFAKSGLAIAYWLGVLQIGIVAPNEFHVCDTGSRPLPHVSYIASQTALIGDTTTSAAKPHKISLTLILHSVDTSSEENGSYRAQTNRRRLSSLENLYFVGYDDGIIVAYKIDSSSAFIAA